ncbi:MAG: ABC transporter permease subunit [Clostridiales bacterium]|jgi:ABC-2 type transport system permease protein|nr:ABC transporter permease subunit [Clostridiales bacterium]
MSAIFKRDLRGYFSSPLGFVFVAAFLIIMNLAFYVTNILSGKENLKTVFSVMLYGLIVVIPILTMRTFSEDYKQRTDQLLLTSPVKASGIVLGKFFAALTVFLIGLAFTVIQVIVIAAFGTPNMGSVIGNYIAVIAAASVYIAIGVFISSLTENQLVAAIASLGIFVGILLMDFSYSLVRADWLKAILYWVSLYRRFNTFYLGVFSIADFFYYISISAVFVFLTVRVLEKKRWS